MTEDIALSAVQDVLLTYLTSNCLEGRLPADGISPETRYLDQGVLNSLGLISFIEFAEEQFGITFTAVDLQSYEFQTPAGVASIVKRIRGLGDGAPSS